MEDLSKTIEPKSDQLNSDDLIAGPINITVRKVTASPSSEDQPVSIFFEGDNNKPFKPAKSMRRLLVAAWGKDGSTYVGKSMTLFRDEHVKWAGLEVGGIRISHLSHIAKPMTLALTATKGTRKPYTVKPLVIDVQEHDELDEAAIKQEATAAARKGKDAFNAHWKSLDKPKRAIVATIMDDLKALAVEADEPPASDDYNSDITPEDQEEVF